MNDDQAISQKQVTEKTESSVTEPADEKMRLSNELEEMNNKYLRLYAEFENYKKRVSKDKEELIKFGNENLLFELLPAIDHLEMALKHRSKGTASSLIQGVEITLREMKKTLEKFGLTEIESEGQPFNPAVHHAMSQVERNDIGENTVVEELRKGYLFKDKVLRPSLVAVSKKSAESRQEEEAQKIKIKKIEEES